MCPGGHDENKDRDCHDDYDQDNHDDQYVHGDHDDQYDHLGHDDHHICKEVGGCMQASFLTRCARIAASIAQND